MKTAHRLPLGNQSIIHIDAAGTGTAGCLVAWLLCCYATGEAAVVRSMQKQSIQKK